MRPGLRRRTVVGLLALLMGLAVAAAVPTAAYASGGGCATTVPIQHGWDISPCSSDDGVYMYADYYIDKSNYITGYCQSRARIENESGQAVTGWEYSDGSLGCRGYQPTNVKFYLRNTGGAGFRTKVELRIDFGDGLGYQVQWRGVGPWTRCC